MGGLAASLHRLLNVAAVLLFIASAISYFRGAFYLELFSHFQAQYFGASIVVVSLFLIFKRSKLLLLPLLSLFLSGFHIVPEYITGSQSDSRADSRELSLLLSNVLTTNRQPDMLFSVIDKWSPDIIVLLEIDDVWQKSLNTLANKYPYITVKPRQDNFGIAMLSRIQPIKSDVIDIDGQGLPSIEAIFEVGQKRFHLLATHPLPPINTTYYQLRNQQLEAVAEWARLIDSPKLVVGDLNITPFSPDYDLLESNTDLNNVRRGFGLLATWPSQLPWLQIPIDHVLLSSHFSVVTAETGPDIGSDHLPIITTLRL